MEKLLGNANKLNAHEVFTQRSVAFYTLGCKLNFSETSTIARQFQQGGYDVRPFNEVADIYVINTCSVTDHADRKTKKYVNDALILNPNAQVVIMGCYAQLKPAEIAAIPGVNLVLGAKEKFNIMEHIGSLERGCEPAIFNTAIKDVKEFNTAYSIGDRTRSFLKIQDGCNYFCSFCTIPLARGRSRNSTIAEVVSAAEEIARGGVKEIVLTGVNIGDFLGERGESFYDVVSALENVAGIERFRISSIEPNLLTNEIIQLVAGSRKFVPHFHIPLQSGSDKILASMRRRYQRQLYLDRVNTIKTFLPDCCIGVDVIVGFPGETEAEFLETYDFLLNLDFSYLHVFSYSERPNTTAIRIKDRVPNRIRSERNNTLTKLSEEKKHGFYLQHVGTTRLVLWESDQSDGLLHGFTDNYLRVQKDFNPDSINTIEAVNLQMVPGETLFNGRPAGMVLNN